ncbi:hypothetical protein LguiB_002612 [Lonicera macranthoides]
MRNAIEREIFAGKIENGPAKAVGLQFIVDSNESTATGKSLISVPITDLGNNLTKTANLLRTRFHRPYPVGISVTLDIMG